MIALGFWDGLDQDSIINSFEEDTYSVRRMRTQIDRTGIDVLFAWYDDPWGYSGEASFCSERMESITPLMAATAAAMDSRVSGLQSG